MAMNQALHPSRDTALPVPAHPRADPRRLGWPSPAVLILVLVPGALLAQRTAVEFQGPIGSSKPYLTPTASGGLLLTWFEPGPEGRWALRIAARAAGGRWSEPRTVLESDRFFVNWADFPSVTETATGDWVVHWLEKTEAKSYAYHIRLARSRDGGRTWSQPQTAHTDRSATEHGFLAAAANPDGSVALVWLDGRETTDSGGNMSVRAATLRPDGALQGETLLDGRSCECCQVAMARTGAGLVAVYRDRSDGEVRDIAVVRELGGRWTPPRIVSHDGWVWRACPVNGPSIDARDQQVAVAWYTAAGDQPRVKVAFSNDGGASFGRPTIVDDGTPLGRVQVRLLDNGDAAVAWLEAKQTAGEWRIRRINPSGQRASAIVLGATARTREAGFSRAAVLPGELYLAWSEPGPDGRVTVRRLEQSRLPLR